MTSESTPTIDLTELAKQAMVERNMLPDIPQKVEQMVEKMISQPSPMPGTKDLRNKLWFSIDNEISRDLDQVTYAERLEEDRFKLYIGIADVDCLVKKEDAIDQFACHNTTSVYTPTKIFPMLPEKLSTNLTSLAEDQDRLAIVIEVTIASNGNIESYDVYPAQVNNHARLIYSSVAGWLDGKIPAPSYFTQRPGLLEQLKLHDEIGAHLRNYLHEQGALTLETIESQPVVENGQIVDVKAEKKNRARDLIEQCMIVANIVIARFLLSHQLPSIRRVVRTPKRWDRIVQIAKGYGEILPDDPNSKTLDLFLIKQRLTDPLHFPDLSLTIVKLLGRGEYVIECPGDEPIGHFSLAIKNYSRSTAPNRRYADMINQRLIKAVFNSKQAAYTLQELNDLANHCTKKEEDADKVERKMKKSAAILVLSSKINTVFDALVTGVTPRGTWVRIFHPPIEGKLVEGAENLDVGDNVKVKLVRVDVAQGFIDFARS